MQTTTSYMLKIVTQKKIAGYTSRLLEGYNSIMAYDDNILSFRFSAYGTLILFNIMNNYYDDKPIASEEIANSIDYKFGSRRRVAIFGSVGRIDPRHHFEANFTRKRKYFKREIKDFNSLKYLPISFLGRICFHSRSRKILSQIETLSASSKILGIVSKPRTG